MQIRSYIKSTLIGLSMFGSVLVPFVSAGTIFNTGDHVWFSSSTKNVKKITVTNVNTSSVDADVYTKVNTGDNEQKRNIGGDNNIWTGAASVWTSINVCTNFNQTIVGWSESTNQLPCPHDGLE